MGKMQRTNLAWDNYMDYLIDVINGSKFMKRAENKPMATSKTEEEIHVSTRAIHLKESADVAKRIAKGLGLNEDYIYASMLMHDAGHPFTAHEGEEIFGDLGDVFNTQYFHHNAKGVEIVMSEDICGKAINKIPNIENNPELRKQLEEEFPYFLDVIISHDGEASKKDMMKLETPYETIQEAVRTKMSLANGTNSYKFIAQTPEGRIAKFADVIAYLSSDMQDGFRIGQLKYYDNEYLQLFGEMFSQDYSEGNKEDKIEYGRKIIEQIKEERKREKSDTMAYMKTDENMKRLLLDIKTKIDEENLNIYNESDVEKIQEIVAQKQEEFRSIKLDEFFKTKGENTTEEQRKNLEDEILRKIENGIALDEKEKEFSKILNKTSSDVNKLEEYATKMLKIRSSVVYEITSRMKEFFINDLIKNSQNQEIPQFSDKAWDLFYRAKTLNYEKYVQYTNWTYQMKELPEAAKALVEKCARSLVKSGAIRNKFYDEDARKYMEDNEALKYMETQYRPEEQYTSYRKENGIGDLKFYAKPIDGRFIGNEQHKLMKLYHDIYSYVQNEEEVFAIRYENTFNALKTRVRRKIETALSNEEQTNKEHLYWKEVQEQINNYRQKIIDTYGTISLTDEQKEEFIKGEIQSELNDMEYKMAVQLSSDYLAGMSDNTFKNLAEKTNHLDKEIVNKSQRGAESNTVKNLIISSAKDSVSKNTGDGEER